MLRIVTDKNEWDNELAHWPASFLHSFSWGEVLEKSGQKIARVIVENGGAYLVALLIYKKTIGKTFLFSPYGPLARGGDQEKNWQELLSFTKKAGAFFLKIEPSNLQDCPGFIRQQLKSVRDLNPMATMVLDLRKSETEILASFHQKTRYNINLAARKEMRPVWEKNFSVFWELMRKTGARDEFALHPAKNYQAAVDSASTRQLTIYSGEVSVAAGCFWIFQNVCYYLYGASDHEYRQLMAPYLMQWEAIKMAKAAGCEFYDLFGIAPTANPNHRYAGVTRFKSGFNGKIVETPGTFDLPLNRFWYFVYYVSRRVRGLSV